jgi:Tol biopolymer transport system component
MAHEDLRYEERHRRAAEARGHGFSREGAALTRKEAHPPAGNHWRVRLVAAVLAAVGCGIALHQPARGRAADDREVTWGAADPAWSPDGSALAFSLFGSIWRVPAAGGEAEQLTSSAGYHALPAWSPDGTLAFVRGQTPLTGEIYPQITGDLVLLDPATGRERTISTPAPVSGSLAWSPDGARIACALGPAMHEIRVASGSVRSLQPYTAARGATAWSVAAWNSARDELFFTASRTRGPQIWSMYPAGTPLTIQMPLTRYGPEDNIMLHSIAAIPDGSGVVYSANPVNRSGNYDLYRIPPDGGKPAALTRTPRDEYSPAVSPDGRRLAFVSNQFGNIDLFTMPVAGGLQTHVRITGLRFRRPAGRLHVRTLDESGMPTPVRFYVRASDGKAYCPPDYPIFYARLDGRDRDGFFISRGDDEFELPAGPARLVVMKGLEYEIAERAIDIPAKGTAEVAIQLQRWADWGRRGWYSGENHIHPNYGGIYYITPRRMREWMEAEDLNAANLMVANFNGAWVHDKEFFRGSLDPLSDARYFLYYGQEFRNASPLGHMAFLNIRRLVPPSYTSVPGSDSPYDFPLNTMAAQQAREQGGLVSYVHPIGTARDVFEVNIGAKESPIAAALGAMDSIDVLPGGGPAYDLWYAFLNCGFRIAPGAGTDTFTNRRGIYQIPGGVREYVETGPAMNWDRWMEAYRQGRDFVTNGPLLTFTVNGSPMGAEIQAPSGQPYQARLEAEIVSRAPVDVVEFIRNGEAIARRELKPPTRSARFEHTVSASGSCWFAVRASGPEARGLLGRFPMAHSGVVYVNTGGRPTLVKTDIELMLRWIDRLWALLDERDNFGGERNREQARRMIEQARRHFEKKLAASN